MAKTDIAAEWLREKTGSAKWKPGKSTTALGKHFRNRAKRPSFKEFVEGKRNMRADHCIFVPKAVKDRPSTVRFCDRTISAARYMALLTFGTPAEEDDEVRHLCGNGHLSCVNPKHLAWGSRSDNVRDMVLHRSANTVADKLAVIADRG